MTVPASTRAAFVVPLLLLAISWPQAEGASVNKDSSYEQDVRYFYNYQGYALTGLPDRSNHYSGFKLNTTVVIEFTNGDTQMTFEDPQLLLVEGNVSPLRPDLGDSPSKLKNNAALTPLAVKLKGPIQFNVKNGLMQDVRTSKSDSYSEANLKKSIAWTFFVNYPSIDSMKAGTVRMIKWNDEDGPEGKCKTGYVHSNDGKTITVQRIRDLLRCGKTAPRFIHSFLLGQVCTKYSTMFNTPLRGESRTTFGFAKGQNGKPFLASSNTFGQYLVPVPKKNIYLFASYISQELTFVRKEKSNGKTLVTDKTKFKTDSIVLTFKTPETDKKMNTNSAMRKVIEERLTKMKTEMNSVDLNAAMRDVVIALRRCSKADILWTIDAAKTTDKRVHMILMEVLGTIGTAEAADVVVSLVKDKTVTDSIAATAVRKLAFSAYDSEAVQKMYEDLCESSRLKDNDRVLTLQSTFAMVGVLHWRISRLVGMTKEKRRAIAQWMSSQGLSKSKTVPTEEHSIRMLMAYGNAGIPELLNDIERYLSSRNTLNVRLHAVNALRKLGQQAKTRKQVRVLLWKIFSNPSEDTELRVSAFMKMILTSPRRRHMSILMSSLRRESSRQLKSFVVSYLQLLSKIGNASPCMRELARLSRWALVGLPGSSVKAGIFDSRIVYIPRTQAMGMYTALVYTRDSPVPRSIRIGELFADDQSFYDIWSVTIRSEESRDIMRNFLTPQRTVRQRLKKLFKKLKKIKKNSLTTVHYTFDGETVLYYGGRIGKSKGNPLSAFGNILKVGKKDARQSVYLDTTVKVPTSFGLPLIWNGSLAGNQELLTNLSVDKDVVMKIKYGSSYALLHNMGFVVDGISANLVFRFYTEVHPGEQPTLSMIVKKPSTKKLSVTFHMMPHKRPSRAVKLALEYLLARQMDLGKIDYRKLPFITPAVKTRTNMMQGMVKIKTYGFKVPPNFKRITLDKEKVWSPVNWVPYSLPFVFSVDRNFPFCGVKFDITFERPISTPERLKVKRPQTPVWEILRQVPVAKSEKKQYTLPKPPFDIRRLANLKLLIRFTVFMMSDAPAKGKRPKMMPRNIGNATLQIDKTGTASLVISSTLLIEKFKLKYSVYNVGQTASFDVNNPFKILTNGGQESTLEFTKINGQKTMILARLTRTSLISANWIAEWKKLLKNPESLAKTWPDVYRCNMDVQEKYFGSPNCYRAWLQLQTADNVTSILWTTKGLSSPMKMQYFIAKMIAPLFSFYSKDFRFTRTGAMINKMSAFFSPSDMRTVYNNRLFYQMILDGFPRWTSCAVKYYRKQRQLYIRTFDGLTYTGNIPKKTVGSSFMITRDRVKDAFSVFVSVEKDKSRSLSILAKMIGKMCLMKITFVGDKPKVTQTGNGCENNIVNGKWESVFYIKFQPLGIKVLLYDTAGLIVMVKRAYYHNSLHGLCGNMDRELNYKELLGCSKSFSNNRNGWDKMMRTYMTEAPKKFTCAGK